MLGDGAFTVSIFPEKSLGPPVGEAQAAWPQLPKSLHRALMSVNRREDMVQT